MAPEQSIWDQDFVNEEHLKAFREALEAEEEILHTDTPNSPIISTQASNLHERPHRISAVSDFAPINARVKRKRRGNSERQGFLYHILRWPLLGMIFTLIGLEFAGYVFIRQCVNAFEYLIAWRGRKRKLRAKLRASSSFEEWKATAKELDEYLGFNQWKKEEENQFYDYKLVRRVLGSLRELRNSDDAHGLLGVLEMCVRSNFAGIESQRLYSETFYKTKDLLEAYTAEVEASLAYVRETPKLSVEEKRRFYRGANTNLGASALCLSGGASFGYYHFGVVRAMLDANMLPRVISGTSAGGLVAALVCTHTDDELRELIVPQLADRITACEEPISVWMQRFWKTGARFDTVQWARKSAFITRGSLTFKEAYDLTGRVLNISVIPYSRYSPTKLLNYLSSPDCVIWSAIIASAAVPGILNPVVLMAKTKSGDIVPWSWGSRFKDGSLRVDIPLQSLNTLFNVNYPIVSQVNPHVHLFNFSPRGSAGKPVARRKGKGWRGGFILAASEQFLKHELTKNFKIIRDLDLLPQLLGQDWSSVFLQRFDGAVTIWPRSRVRDWFRLLTDPDPPELERMIRVGQLVSWPKLHMIENRYRFEKEIYRGRMAVRQELQVRERERGRSRVEADPGGGTADASEQPTLLQTPGAGSSNGDRRSASPNDGVPWPSASRQLPIESETESRAREHRLLRRFRNRDRPTVNDEPITPEPSVERTPNGTLRSPQSGLRRRWAVEHPDDDEEDDDDAGPPVEDPFSQSSHNGSNQQPSSSLIERFRSKSFPVISTIAHSFRRPPKRQDASQSPPQDKPAHEDSSPPQVSVEQWSSESEEEELGAPWPGVFQTPNVGSPMIFRSTPNGGSYFEQPPLTNGDLEQDDL